MYNVTYKLPSSELILETALSFLNLGLSGSWEVDVGTNVSVSCRVDLL